MSLIETTLDGTTNKVDKAIERIRCFDPLALGIMDQPYYVAYSGGKDSDVIRILFELSGVKYDLVHNHTTVDAPETVRYVRSIQGIKINYPEITMWQLIVKKRMPPTRIARYCCDYLKERGGADRFISTGVRWAESPRRKARRGSLEIQPGGRREFLILNADNDESRMMFETCKKKSRHCLNPIIDWSDDDVWEFLHYYGCESNPLYQCGFRRIGCVGCPMGGSKNQKYEFERYPKYKQNYIRAFERMIEANQQDGKAYKIQWKNGQEAFDWWTSDKKSEVDKNQLSLWGSVEI